MLTRFLKAAAPVVVAAAVLVACSGGGGQSSQRSTDVRNDSSSTSDSSSGAGGVDVLKKVALKDTDLSGGAKFRLIPGGDQVRDQVTLDVCGADFPSEALRAARYQQVASPDGKTLLVNNENVMYKSAAGATQALDEVRAAVQNCPADTFVPSKVADVPPLKFNLQLLTDDQLGPLAVDHLAVSGTAADRTGQTQSQVQVFERRGKVLVGIYGSDLQTIKPFINVVAERLAALSSKEAGE